MKSTISILDIVATKKSFPEHNILAGQVGTVVEILEDGFVEVEFSIKKEEEPILLAINSEDLMLLHFELEKV